MPRRPPRLLVAASAVLLAAVVALWVQSYFVGRCVKYERELPVRVAGGDCTYHERGVYVFVSHGQLRLVVSGAPPPDPAWMMHGDRRITRVSHWSARAPVGPSVWPETLWSRIGFHVRTEESAGGPGLFRYYRTDVAIPMACLVVPLALVPLRRLRRPPRGHCQMCGYDLTANASERCPECGAAAEAAPVHR